MTTIQEKLEELKTEIITAKNAPAFAVGVKVKSAERCTELAFDLLVNLSDKMGEIEQKIAKIEGSYHG